jgi:phosphate/sulfate permease
MRVQRYLRKVSKFMTQLGAALVKTVLTTLILGVVVVSIMHYMGVPVPSSDDLLRGVERLAHVLS